MISKKLKFFGMSLIFGAASILPIAIATSAKIGKNNIDVLKRNKPFPIEEVTKLGEEGKNNAEVLIWISEANFNKYNLQDIQKKLLNLDINIELKQFMNQNLIDKHTSWKMRKERDKSNKKNNNDLNLGIKKMMLDVNNGGSSGGGGSNTRTNIFDSRYIHTKKNFNIKDRWEDLILKRGTSDKQPILMTDGWWSDDVSIWRRSNQDVFNMHVFNSDNSIGASIRKLVKTFKLEIQNVQRFLRVLQYTNADLGTSAQIKVAIAVLVEQARDIIRNKDYLISIGAWSNGLEIYLNGVIGVGNIFGAKSLISEIMARSIGLAIVTPEPISTALGVIALVVLEVMNTIPAGNDHTIWENIGDKGLNDLYYQLDHNYGTMARIAKSWSDTYHRESPYVYYRDYWYGIAWKITDGWFSYPELYIKTQDMENSYRLLSQGNTFNFGNKIKFQSFYGN